MKPKIAAHMLDSSKVERLPNVVVAEQRASPFYSTVEAAEFLNLSPRTLEKMRVQGGGPQFLKFGRRVLYDLRNLQEWTAQRRCESTSASSWKR